MVKLNTPRTKNSDYSFSIPVYLIIDEMDLTLKIYLSDFDMRTYLYCASVITIHYLTC